MSRLGAILTGASIITASLVGLTASLAVALTIWTPAVREHCSQSGSPTISSRWRIDPLSLVGATDFVSKDKVCIRNTPLREGLSAIGIWQLGTPEEQFDKMFANVED